MKVMSLPRFYVQIELNLGQTIHLPMDVSHHLLNVLRLKPGHSIIIYNGTGGEFHGELLKVSKKTAIIALIGYQDINRTASINVNLGLCVLKRNAMDRAIARCVELGVHTLTPLISERCSVAHRIIQHRHNHWQQIIVTATEQCGLNILPSLESAVPLPTWLNSAEADLKLIASPEGQRFPNSSGVRSVAMVIGPEGGFTIEELRLATATSFCTVKLGERILRAENAPAVALSAIHQSWGDFSY